MAVFLKLSVQLVYLVCSLRAELGFDVTKATFAGIPGVKAGMLRSCCAYAPSLTKSFFYFNFKSD